MRYQVSIDKKTIAVDPAELIKLVCDGHVAPNDLIIRDKDKARYQAEDLDFLAPIFNLRKKQVSSVDRASSYQSGIVFALIVIAAFAVNSLIGFYRLPKYKRTSSMAAAAKEIVQTNLGHTDFAMRTPFAKLTDNTHAVVGLKAYNRNDFKKVSVYLFWNGTEWVADEDVKYPIKTE